jgi:hypothetical protein
MYESAMKRALFPAFLILTACGTPQEQCIGAATRDMRVVDRLITEAEGNLSRGYGYENVTVFMPEWQDCTPRPTAATPEPKPRMCLEEVPQTSRQPVALDLAAEAAKLKGLKAKRAQQAKAATSAVNQCKAQYPE